MENVVRANEFADAESRAVAQPVASIIVPIHNEESFLAGALAELRVGLAETGLAYELILCENGSTDATRELAFSLADEELHTRLLTTDSPDYGGAMKMGVLAARGPHIIVFDIDYFSVRFLNEALALLEDCDVVLASKLAPETQDKRGLGRQAITRGFSLVLKLLFNTKLDDTHGMKAFRRKKIEPLVLQCRMSKDLFDTELLLRAEQNGLKIKEIPVVIEEKRATRSNILKRIPRTVFGLLRLRYIFAIESRGEHSA